MLCSVYWSLNFDFHFIQLIFYFRYKVGQRFGRHFDGSVDLGEEKRTHYTLLIYLIGGPETEGKSDLSNLKDSASEPLVGGETVFYDSWNEIVAEANFFPFMLLLSFWVPIGLGIWLGMGYPLFM